MASRYWVGGTGNWSDDDNHWASVSNGTPANGNLPTSSDDVFIDENSGFGGGGTITLGGYVQANNFTSNSGHSYSVSGGTLGLNGSVVLESGTTFVEASASLLLEGSGNETLTANDSTIYTVSVSCSGTYTLQDDLTLTGDFYQENGTFDANDHNVTADRFYFYAGDEYTPTVVMGSGTWIINNTAGDGWLIEEEDGESVTITPESSTIKIVGGDGEVGFYSNGKSYNNFWLADTTDAVLAVYGSNTFNNFKSDAGMELSFARSTTTTVTTFTAVGEEEGYIYINSFGAYNGMYGSENQNGGYSFEATS